MNENIIPEISHKTLHQIILYIKLLKLGNIEYFLTKFIVPPSWAYIMEVKMLLIGKNIFLCTDITNFNLKK